MHQGVQFSGSLSLSITQSKGTLGGTYSTTGTLSDGVQSGPVTGTGQITGTIGAGTNSTVTIQLKTSTCPSAISQITGVRDSANRRVVLTGAANIYYSDTCEIFHSHPMQLTIQQ